MHARNVLDELLEHLKDLIPPLLQNSSHLPSQSLRSPHMWLPQRPSFSCSERDLVARWRHYLIWETKDPLHLRQNDPSMFLQRVSSAYEKALVHMRFYPELWSVLFGVALFTYTTVS